MVPKEIVYAVGMTTNYTIIQLPAKLPEVQLFNFQIVTNSIIALKLHLSSVRGAKLNKRGQIDLFIISLVLVKPFRI